MNKAVQAKFQAATKGLNLTGDEKRSLADWYADDYELIETLEQDFFTMLLREQVKRMRNGKA